MSPDLESDTEPTHDEELSESPDGDKETEDDYEHLKSLDDGAGCTEIWEHLSEGRDE
jgi:hypothetical protein